MHWNDWILICWTISIFFELRKQHWISAAWSACLTAFSIVDRLPPAEEPAQARHHPVTFRH